MTYSLMIKIMATYSTKDLGHLGLFSGKCKEIGVANIVDNTLPNTKGNS